MKTWRHVRASYWFVPGLMSIGAVGLSFLLLWTDQRMSSEWALSFVPGQPGEARQLLVTIASSMLGVAGVTFSVAVASVAYVSGQYGPRLLSDFMRDTGNQVTLGTLIGTFVYCILVMRGVRSAPEGGVEFVPQIALLGGLVLGMLGLVVLIYFLHHVPESIHISNVIARIGRRLHHEVDARFPGALGAEAEAEADAANSEVAQVLSGASSSVASTKGGYLLALDEWTLMRAAAEHDVVLELRYRPGDFVTPGKPLARCYPSSACSEEAAAAVRSAFAFGGLRTPEQDVLLLAEELVEIATRALSPGINEPFTAMRCLDWLGGALEALVQHAPPDPRCWDEKGTLRVIVRPTTFADFAESIFGSLRPYLTADRNAALHTFKVIGEIAGVAESAETRGILRHHVDALFEGCEARLTQATDLDEIRQRHRAVRSVLRGEEAYDHAAYHRDWLGGSA